MNWAGWSAPAYDRLIEQASSATSPEQRFEYFQQAEAILLEQAPVIPIYYDAQVYLKQPYVHGWLPSKIDFHRFSDLWLER